MGEGRKCAVCGEMLVRREGEAPGRFLRRKTCGRSCASRMNAALRRERRGVAIEDGRRCEGCGDPLVKKVHESFKAFSRRGECTRGCRRRSVELRSCPECGDIMTLRNKETPKQYAARRTCAKASCLSARSSRQKMKRVRCNCLACGADFETVPSAGRNYCSKACAYKGMRKAVYDEGFGCLVRECTQCGKTKPLGQFGRHDKTKHRPYCKECQSAYHQRWRSRHLQQARESSRDWYRENRDHVLRYNTAYRKKIINSTIRHCLRCGKSFRPTSVERRYCSVHCARATVVELRRERGEWGMPVAIECKECGASVVDSPSRIARRYCSRECAAKARMRGFASRADTAIERAVYAALDKLSVGYIRQHPIGTWVVDAFVPSLHLVIECQGDYWHCNPKVYPNGPETDVQKRGVIRDKRRRRWFQARRYRYVEIWESDIHEIGADRLVADAVESL